MSWNQVEGDWKQYKGKLRGKWEGFTDEEFEHRRAPRHAVKKMRDRKKTNKKAIRDWDEG